MSTSDNLQAAFAGESQANRKYLAFAIKAGLGSKNVPVLCRLHRTIATDSAYILTTYFSA